MYKIYTGDERWLENTITIYEEEWRSGNGRFTIVDHKCNALSINKEELDSLIRCLLNLRSMLPKES